MERLNSGERIGGTIKSTPDDFVVEEITKSGVVLETGRTYKKEDLLQESGQNEDQKFSNFVLQKRNWSTIQALKVIAKKFGRGVKSTGYAGMKDRNAVSTQLCSAYGITPESLLNLRIKDISINGAWSSDKGLDMGDLLGNRFTIKIRDPQNRSIVDDINSRLNGIFPNYYGEQRFGNRGNNIEIGLDILRNDFKAAALKFLTDTSNERMEEAVEARKRLASELDFKAALEYFPRYLKYEHLLIDHLSRFPDNYANALRRLPRALLLMFVHSVESSIFNKVLENRVKAGEILPKDSDILCYPNFYGFPDYTRIVQKGDKPKEVERVFIVGNIIGYDTQSIMSDEKDVLDELGISQEQFKLTKMPEINCKGSQRALFAPYIDFSHSSNAEGVMMKFSLPAGSYATVLLGEFI